MCLFSDNSSSSTNFDGSWDCFFIIIFGFFQPMVIFFAPIFGTDFYYEFIH